MDAGSEEFKMRYKQFLNEGSRKQTKSMNGNALGQTNSVDIEKGNLDQAFFNGNCYGEYPSSSCMLHINNENDEIINSFFTFLGNVRKVW